MRFQLLVLLVSALSCFGLQFQCHFYDSIPQSVIGVRYECNVKVLIDLSDQNLVAVSGNTEMGRFSSDVQFVEIENALELTYIPQNMLSQFPRLVSLRMDRTGLQNLEARQLSAYTSLISLTLTNNEISIVPENFLKATPNLVFINFNANKIKIVGFHLFKTFDYNAVQYIGFKDNICVNAEYNNTAYENEPNFYRFLYDVQVDCTPETTTTVTTTTEPATTEATTSQTESSTSFIPTMSSSTSFSSTTSPPTPKCKPSDLSEEVCKLQEQIQYLAYTVGNNAVVFKKFEEVLLFVQESMKEIVALLNMKLI